MATLAERLTALAQRVRDEFNTRHPELAVSAIGKPAGSQVLARFVATRAGTLVAADSRGSARVAAGAQAVFTVKKNGASVATFTFASAAALATVAVTTAAYAAGDVLTWHAPSTADATLEDVALTLAVLR